MQDYPVASHSARRTTAGRHVPRRLRRILSLDDFEAGARHLPPPSSATSPAAARTALPARQPAGFAEYGFVTRVFTSRRAQPGDDAVRPHYAAPFGIAPMGISALSAYRGDMVLARAAAAANIPMIMSGTSLIRMEDVCAANPASWFQAYVPGEPERSWRWWTAWRAPASGRWW